MKEKTCRYAYLDLFNYICTKHKNSCRCYSDNCKDYSNKYYMTKEKTQQYQEQNNEN